MCAKIDPVALAITKVCYSKNNQLYWYMTLYDTIKKNLQMDARVFIGLSSAQNYKKQNLGQQTVSIAIKLGIL